MFQYSVIIFTEEGSLKDTVTVVPTSWLLADKTQSYWPTFSAGKANQRQRLILTLAEPLTQVWPTKAIKFCHSYKTYNVAQDAAKKQAKQVETVSSEPAEQGRGRRNKFKSRRPLDTSSGSGSENESPVPPKKSRKEDKTSCPKQNAPLANLEVAPDFQKIQSLLKKQTPRSKETSKEVPEQNRFTGGSGKTSTIRIQETCQSSNNIKVHLQAARTNEKVHEKSAAASAISLQTLKRNAGPNSPEKSAVLVEQPLPVGKKTFITPDPYCLPGTGKSSSLINAVRNVRTHVSPVMPQETPTVVEQEYADHRHSDTRKHGSETDASEDSNASDLLNDSDLFTHNDILYEEHNQTGQLSEIHSDIGIESSNRILTNLNDLSAQACSKESFSQNSSISTASKSTPAKPTGKKSGKKRVAQLSSKLSELKASRNRETLVVAEILEEMKSKLDIQGMNIAKILQCVDPEEAVIERPHGLPSLPLADESAFNEFESFLDVPTHFTGSSLYLSGKLMDQTVPYKGAQKLLRTMISNNLARAISWEGTFGTKIAFNKTKSCEVLLSALLRRFSEKHMGLVREKIQKWFTTSQGRKVSTTHQSAIESSEGND